MKVLAGEGAPHGILVNGMLVGLIDSDQVARRHAREGTQRAVSRNYVAKMGTGIPVGRMGKAEEFAAWPASCAPITQASPPARRSTWTAAPRPWSDACIADARPRA